jgi:cell division septation protein DedD
MNRATVPAAALRGTAQTSQPSFAPAAQVDALQFHIQAGVFRNREYADDLVRQLRTNGYTVTLVEGPLLRVWVGPPMSQQAAERLAANLRLNGFEAALSRVR